MKYKREYLLERDIPTLIKVINHSYADYKLLQIIEISVVKNITRYYAILEKEIN